MASDLSNPIGFENTPAAQNGTESISLETSYSGQPAKQGLYNPSNERDACGVGFVAHIKGKKSHDIVQKGLELLTNLTHRGATGYDPKLGMVLVCSCKCLMRSCAKKRPSSILICLLLGNMP